MKARSAVILTHQDEIALIERLRLGRHYYTFPGGKVKATETSAQAAARETLEELGLEVEIGEMVAEVWYQGAPQYYYLAEATGGQFGQGSGLEMSSSAQSGKGSYHPIWMDIDQLTIQPVLPKIMAKFVVKSHREGWPERPLVQIYLTPDDV